MKLTLAERIEELEDKLDSMLFEIKVLTEMKARLIEELNE